MVTLRDVFALRLQLDRLRQPNSARWLDLASQWLDRERKEHPYELDETLETELFSHVSATAAAGSTATLECADHLYRLASYPSIQYALQWKKKKILHSDLVADLRDNGGQWLALSVYADGLIQNERGFSWWTTYDAIDRDPFRAGHRLGLPDKWIAVRAVILRCSAAEVRGRDLARIPMPIDALCSPIFAATRSSDNPAHGVTMDLRGTDTPTVGVPEVALLPVPSEIVDFMPIEIDARGEPNVQWDTTTWARLLRRYQELLDD
jgi:hypothetical protein